MNKILQCHVIMRNSQADMIEQRRQPGTTAAATSISIHPLSEQQRTALEDERHSSSSSSSSSKDEGVAISVAYTSSIQQSPYIHPHTSW